MARYRRMRFSDRTRMCSPPPQVSKTQVCNSKGDPVVVFHGTTHNFDRFSNDELYSLGNHFGCPDQANHFANGVGGRIFPVYLQVKSIIDFGSSDLGWGRPRCTAYFLVQHHLIAPEQAKLSTGLEPEESAPQA